MPDNLCLAPVPTFGHFGAGFSEDHVTAMPSGSVASTGSPDKPSTSDRGASGFIFGQPCK